MSSNTSPPPALRLAAALAIVFGSVSLVGMAASLLRGNMVFDLGVLGIPIGRGLLEGKVWSRSWAMGLSGFGVVLIFVTVGWGVVSGEFRGVSREPLWLSGAYFCLSLLVCATVFFGLRTCSVRAWFSADSSDRSDSTGWVKPLVVVGILFAAVFAIRESMMERSLAGLFAVHTRFVFRDASTGGPIHSVGYAIDGGTYSNAERDPFAPRILVATTSAPQGLVIKLTGLSGRPVQVTFTSEGYQPCPYTLGDQSPEEVTLSFEPVK
jgi:hypothetical protein